VDEQRGKVDAVEEGDDGVQAGPAAGHAPRHAAGKGGGKVRVRVRVRVKGGKRGVGLRLVGGCRGG